MIERTLAIIKPAAVKAKHSGKIIDIIENRSFTILRMQKMQLKPEQVREFYIIHKERPFFGEMIEVMVEGPSIVMVLEKENAIKEWRDLMGATDPQKAEAGTIRKQFGMNIGRNAVHGSDSPDNAAIEIKQFFPDLK